MNRRARVHENKTFAGILEETGAGGYRFAYDPAYLASPLAPSISFSLPKRSQPYESPHLFAFFQGIHFFLRGIMFTEDELGEDQCVALGVDKDDRFGRLVKAAGGDTIGSVTLMPDGEW